MMKRFAVIGNSLSAIKVIEELRLQGEDLEAVFVSPENTFPYFRHLLYSLPSKKITQNKVLYRAPADYENDRIKFIFDKKMTRINFKRGRITLDDKEQVDYDFLLLSDLPQQPFFGMKGANKTGLYHVKRLADISVLLKALPSVETLFIQSDSLAGIKAALAFANLSKEVILVSSKTRVCPDFLYEADVAAIDNLISLSGIRVIAQSQIVEILGDHEAKAVRLQGADNKVYGCQAILTDSDFPDLRLFKETDLKHHQRVVVNPNKQTNFENVFAMDAVCDTITSSDWDMALSYPVLAQEQSKLIAAAILRKEYIIQNPVLSWDIEAGDQKVTVSTSIGQSLQTSCINA